MSDLGDIELVECDPARDGELIRDLTRASFHEAMRSIWDEARHLAEPRDPARYRMVRRGGQTIGFFALRRDDDFLYLQTIQLVPAARGQGVGTRLMRHIQGLAAAVGARGVRLRVLRSNERAQHLYEQLGYSRSGEDDLSLLLELES